jgi:ABC-type lipoprotein release transport system permease subunit
LKQAHRMCVGVAALMALAGSLLPVWRAVRVDPLQATRTE